MDQKTRKALQGSIRKWQKIVSGTGFDLGLDNCPLCTAFIDNDCRGCPVFEKTRRTSCSRTPYSAWVEAQLPKNQGFVAWRVKADTPALKKLAVKELKFLESLL